MKKRLNILCVIVVFVLGYSVFETGYYFLTGLKAGVKAGIENRVTADSKQEMMHMKYVSLMPEHLSVVGEGGLFQDSVYNEKSGRYVPASFSSMMVSVDTKSAVAEQVVSFALSFLHLGVCICAIILFVRLVISINRSDIFSWKNVHRLRLLGGALIVSFCTSFLSEYLTFRSVGEVFAVHGYKLDISEMVNVTTLVLGISTLIVGEVFAIGLKMKEEQDLTI